MAHEYLRLAHDPADCFSIRPGLFSFCLYSGYPWVQCAARTDGYVGRSNCHFTIRTLPMPFASNVETSLGRIELQATEISPVTILGAAKHSEILKLGYIGKKTLF